MNITRAGALSLAMALLVACALETAASATTKRDPLLGRWRAVAMDRNGRKEPLPRGFELLSEFRPGGKFVSVIADGHHGSRSREGTWRRERPNTLVMVVGQRSDRMRYRFDGRDRLVLRNPRGGQRLFLQRVPAER